MFFFLCCLFLMFCCLSSNPMLMGFYFIFSLIFIAPILVLLVSSWMVYLFLMLFLTGILIVVLYFTCVSKFSVKHPSFLFFYFWFLILSYPFFIYFLSFNFSSVLFVMESLFVLGILLLSLIFLILFTSYLLSHGVAMRNF